MAPDDTNIYILIFVNTMTTFKMYEASAILHIITHHYLHNNARVSK